MTTTLGLSEAKARLSEVIRNVRRTGEDAIITLDGEAAVRISAVPPSAQKLTAVEAATAQALFAAILTMPHVEEPCDAVELIRDGRR